MPEPVFNLRVYGLLIHDGNVLISGQTFNNVFLRKFPGGGVQFGEGLLDALKREFLEEVNLDIEILSHFYTTDFFVPSAFHQNNQVISVFYLVRPSGIFNAAEITSHKSPDGEILSWKSIHDLSEEDFPLPIEKVVCRLLKDAYT